MRKDILSKKEAVQFYRLKNNLYLFANKKSNILRHDKDWQDVMENSLEEMIKIRNYVFIKNISIIDEYIKLNPNKLSNDELDIISQWKKLIYYDKAMLFKYTNENSLFLIEKNVYAVLGLTESFKDILEGSAPVFLELIILPFKNKLVQEGVFETYSLSLSRNMTNSMIAEAEEIVIKQGIISSLDTKNTKKTPSDQELLRFYMKSQANIEKFFEKIKQLRSKSQELRAIYNYEVGRINAKDIKKQLKGQNIKGCFAILFSQVIASGINKKELIDNLEKILPKEREKEVYIIKI